MQPARSFNGFSRRHPVINDSGSNRRLGLRLAFAAHRAVNDRAPIVQQRQRGVQRVEWFAARPEVIERALVERKAAAPILPVDARVLQHDAAAELVIKTLLGGKMGLDATHKWPGETQREWGRAITMDPAVQAKVSVLLERLLARP